MKTKIILLFLGILITLLFPLLLFQMQDNIDMHSTKYESSEDFHQITETYPIISAIYADTYEDNKNDLSAEYNLSLFDTYAVETQKEILQRKQEFETQIQLLIQHEVLPSSIFPSDTTPYTITYGSLTICEDPSFTTNLQQVLSIDQSYVHHQFFSYSRQAGKITNLYLSNPSLASLRDEDCQKLAWKMVQYLGLSEIKDWNTISHGYESYQAKLQVYCEKIVHVDGYASLRIGVLPISLSLSTYLG